ncbi:ComEA family DNA-binding protein [Chlorobium phaeobacteroides]|uniref:Helix-hairpin-helix motif protein n=1 Tax=Chlorobium phaeobacteroides (strain DSM 266 / SMG 266 / 2430) TaxID=290317 RepID=A1BIQ0_CHLPD|nr:helix-hairpin-helix domain-containing protein [Chlorobium phaeobacteroides]ABL66277.1 helix-hairpin-helix motif protein [Chlorobium phaeobacteroides DSM 266]
MNPFDQLSRKLSLTRTEVSVISLLLLFLLLGGVVKQFHLAERSATLSKAIQKERYQEADVDSLIRLASIAEQHGTAAVDTDFSEEIAAASEETGRSTKSGNRSGGKKVFSGTISFNKASEKQLQKIPGVGPVMAKRLVAFRASKGGRVSNVEQLLEVKGIGKKKLEVLRKHLTME